MSVKLTPSVLGFMGENRQLQDELLPDNIAVDGQNVDYSRGTVKKALGFAKTHTKAYNSGGLRFDNTGSNNRSVIIQDQTYLDLAGDFTVECIIKIESDPSTWTNGAYIVMKRSGTDGWSIRYFSTTTVWSFQKCDSSPSIKVITVPGDITASTHPVVGETYHLAMWRTGTSFGAQVTRLSDGTIGSATPTTCSGDTSNTRNVYMCGSTGATPAAQINHCILDEVRIWADQRTTTELADCAFRELTTNDQADANLIGYWKMNDSSGTTVEDSSGNRNHGALYASTPTSPPTPVPSIMPTPSPANYAFRGNGVDAYAQGAYTSNYSTILNTGLSWTIEFWARLDTAFESTTDMVLCQLGSSTVAAGNNGHVFQIYITWPGSGAAPLLKYSWSSLTTASNTARTPSTAFNPEPGVPFHVRLVRGLTGAVNNLYVNGTLIDANSHGITEVGPSTLTTHGIKLLHQDAAGTISKYAACTIDEVRLYSSAFAQPLSQIMNIEVSQDFNSTLVGYWRLNAESFTRDEKGYSNLTVYPTGGTNHPPIRTYGLAYPASPAGVIKLIAPVVTPVATSQTEQGQVLLRRELLVATKNAFFSQQGSARVWLKDLDSPGSDNLYSYTRFNNLTVCCNGVGRNYVYDGRFLPTSMTLPTFASAAPTMTVTTPGTGTFPATGEYRYRFAWYNSNLDIEGLASSGETAGYETATIAATTNNVAIAAMPSSLSGYPEVTHIRIYRLDVSATSYRYLTQVAIGTTTYTDTGTSVTSAAAQNTLKGYLNPQNIVEVFQNRIFAARESTLSFSEANTMDFPAANIIYVDRADGEPITGLKAYQGQLIVFKKTNVFVLDGDGPTTFTLRKIIPGVGCLAHATIAPSPAGLYFLGLDGIYLFNGQNAQLISQSQNPILQRTAHDKAQLAAGLYHPELHQYILSFDCLTEAAATGDKPAQEAYDNADLSSLFTHYYRCITGADAVGTGGTINDAQVTFVADTQRGTVLWEQLTTNWRATITGQTAVSSDFTVGFWKKQLASTVSPIGTSFFDLFGATFRVRFDTYQLLNNINTFMRVGTSDDGNEIGQVQISSETKWNHYVVRKSGTVYSFFINGQLIAAGTGANPNDVFVSLGAQVAAFNSGASAYLDNIFWVRNVALTAAQIKSIYDYEASSITDTERITLLYDEQTQTWAKKDKTFDCFASQERSSHTAEGLAAFNGFIVRLFTTYNEGVQNDGDTAKPYTRSGTLSATSGQKITDSTASFQTTDNGLSGVEFVAVPTDTSLEIQKRTIVKNTGTVLYLDTPLISAVTGTYYIGPVYTIWESRWMDIGTPGAAKAFQFLNLFLEKVSGRTFTIKYKTDDYDTYIVLSQSTAAAFARLEIPGAGRRLKIRIEAIQSSDTFAMRGFQVQYDEQEMVSV
jgi:hypothetical protein